MPETGDRTMEGEHLDLLRTARSVQHAAIRDDVDSVHDELCRLRNALVGALQHDRREPPASDIRGRLTRHGKERILHFVDRALLETPGQDGCSCLLLSAELRAMLVRQIRLETEGRPRGR